VQFGENAKTDGLEVNPMKAQQFTNFRERGQGRRDPPAQALPRPARAEESEPGEAGGLTAERYARRSVIRVSAGTSAASPG
jgi:hypothetical protein